MGDPLRAVRDARAAGPVRKEDAECCVAVASRDPHGRLPVGFCGPECERRAAHLLRNPERWRP